MVSNISENMMNAIVLYQKFVGQYVMNHVLKRKAETSSEYWPWQTRLALSRHS